MFSVVIPTHNRAYLVKRAIDSVLAQETERPQTIVVDDGSVDETPTLLASYGQTIEILNQQNRGPGAARNLGTSAAKGEYVVFLDSDDLLFPWALSTYRRFIETHRRPAFIAGRPKVFHAENELTDILPNQPTCAVFRDYFESGDQWRWYGASSFVMRRDALLAAGGCTEAFVNAEDADLAMKLGEASGFVHVLSPVTFAYRSHGGNITGDSDKLYRGSLMMIENERRGTYSGGRSRKSQRWRILSRHLRAASLTLLKSGRPREAWDLYCRTLPWNCAERRIPYILGFPIIAARAALSKTTKP